MEDKNILYGPEPFHPLADGTAGEQMFYALSRYADISGCIALTNAHTKENVLYEEFLKLSCRLAESFKKYGLKQNDTIAVCSENGLQFFLPLIASLYLGIIAAPVSDKYIERELIHSLGIVKPRIIFCSKNTFQKVLNVKSKLKYVETIIILDLNEDLGGYQCLNNFISQNSDINLDVKKFKPNSFNRDDQVALVMFSSGTTGVSKGVMLTHKNIVARFSHCKDPTFGNAINPTTAILTVIPFHHGFGMTTTLGYFTCGFRVALMHTFEEKLFLQSLQDYKVESTLLVPTLMAFFPKSALVEKYDLSHLKEIASGGAPLSKEIGEMVKKRFKLNFVRQGYGLTETTSAVLITPDTDVRPGSTGKIVPFHAVKVVDPTTGKILGPNETGELYFKGDMIMKSYYNNEEATKAIINKDGWLRSGDIAYYDNDGHFYIVDRLKSLIKYKGYQVAPAEIEGILLQHPYIVDAGVTGIPDEAAGELPAAGVVVQTGKYLNEQIVQNFVSSQVSTAKWLRGGVKFLDEIPKGSTGKIDRKVLRQMFEKHKSKL
uniref:Luciferin 4-monooxygenase n=1 Tax=Photuris pensylvanica TaxID=1710587 RepID=LUCI_PHOPE|nr:RecName: Full=Luciferin 4-monooxygenase; Short=Luciferase [Photuris pensylvanica]AAB60897.1 luciferase [Photuris pensylvanica]